jgi:hypothetical protein
VFHRQFEAMVYLEKWASCEKTAHFLAVMQGQAADFRHSVSPEATYENMVGTLKGQNGDHQLAAEYRAQRKAITQLIGE